MNFNWERKKGFVPENLKYQTLCENCKTSSLPDEILPSCAAGPSFNTFFTCRNSSGLSPPIIVNPNPIVLFFSDVRISVPINWDGSRVKKGFACSAHKENAFRHVYSKIGSAD